MKKIIFLLMLFLATPANANDKLKIFACEPEWEALSKQIGGGNVETFSATTANQDPHYIRAKPSLISKMRKADLLICSGADLEVGWLPILLENAKKNVQVGGDGYLMAADFVKTIEKPTVLDRSMGDVHPGGNPHLHLNPYNILIVAGELNNRLQKIDSGNAQIYQKNYDEFVKKWKSSIKIWEAKATKLKGKKLVAHHKSFSYLISWLKMEEAANLEPKPGIPATASHLESLIKELKSEPVSFIIKTPYDPEDASKWLSGKTGVKVITLPYTINGDEKSGDLFSLFDQTINLLISN